MLVQYRGRFLMGAILFTLMGIAFLPDDHVAYIYAFIGAAFNFVVYTYLTMKHKAKQRAA